MTLPSRHRRTLAIITLLSLLPVAFCAFCGWLYLSDPSLVANTHKVEALLEVARTHPVGAFPEEAVHIDLSYMGVEYLSGCWTALQAAAQQQGNDYTLEAVQNGYQYRNVDDSVVTITFADGQQISMSFYQGTLVGCRIE